MGVERLEAARDARRLFDGSRLRVARELRGLTQKDIADAAQISPAAVGQFEKGIATPNAHTLATLSEVVRFPPGFFRGDVVDSRPDTPAFFRSLRSTSVRDRRQARAFVELVREFTLALETKVELPPNGIPRFPTKPDPQERKRVDDIAAIVRAEWGIAKGEPVDHVARLVERHGAIVTRVQSGFDKIDAFSVPYDDRPVLVLCADKGWYDRSRFDTAHELGHLVLHDPKDCGERAAEKQADEFAAAFLMPTEGIADELPRTADWGRLIALKRRWGVSIAALLYRAKTLEVMTDDNYLRAVKIMSARGWRKNEPEPLGAPESPQLLHKAVAVLEAQGHTVEELAGTANLPVEQVRTILQATAPTRPRVRI